MLAVLVAMGNDLGVILVSWSGTGSVGVKLTHCSSSLSDKSINGYTREGKLW